MLFLLFSSLKFNELMAFNEPVEDYCTLCWGSTKHGQLGLGPAPLSADTKIPVPQPVPQLWRQEVVGTGCGAAHTVFLLAGGTLCSCGNNDWGQLGHDKEGSKQLGGCKPL